MTTTFFWKSITAALLVGGAMSTAAVSLARRPPEPEPSPNAPAARPAPEEKQAESRSLLENGGVEEGEKDAPNGWSRGDKIPGVAYLWSRDTAHAGKASLCLKKTADRYFPSAQWYQTISRKGDAPRLKVSAWIKADNAGKAILDAQFIDGDGEGTHAWVSYIGAKEADDPPVTHDWKQYEGVVTIPPGTKQILIAPQIYGPGTVWFDDLKAEYTNDPAQPL